MQNQFIDLSVPDPTVEYYCDALQKSSGFTHLMKLVMMVNNFPDAMQLIKMIIKNNPEEINKVNNLGYSALLLTCRHCYSNNSLECVKMLLESGADINIVAADYRNVLYVLTLMPVIHLDIKYECFKILLLNQNMNINLNSNRGGNVLQTVLYDASQYSLRIAKLLIKKGADVNFASEYRVTPLNSLCRKITPHSFECIQLLIEHGANLNIQNILGESALINIFKNYDNYNSNSVDSHTDYYNCAKLLIESGADVNLIDTQHMNVLQYYCIKFIITESNLDLLFMIIDHTDNVTYKNKHGMTVYDYYKLNHNRFSNDMIEQLLKGNITLGSNIKSARKVTS